MQIHNNTLIAECPSYDFKEMLERKKVKSCVKSVSVFANTDGGSLFYGVNDDGEIVGLENPQVDADFISETIKVRLNPIPKVQFIPIEHEGHTLFKVKVKLGILICYFYQDGTHIQDRDIYKVPSMRRNPVIADMFTQLDYMEKTWFWFTKDARAYGEAA